MIHKLSMTVTQDIARLGPHTIPGVTILSCILFSTERAALRCEVVRLQIRSVVAQRNKIAPT